MFGFEPKPSLIGWLAVVSIKLMLITLHLHNQDTFLALYVLNIMLVIIAVGIFDIFLDTL